MMDCSPIQTFIKLTTTSTTDPDYAKLAEETYSKFPAKVRAKFDEDIRKIAMADDKYILANSGSYEERAMSWFRVFVPRDRLGTTAKFLTIWQSGSICVYKIYNMMMHNACVGRFGLPKDRGGLGYDGNYRGLHILGDPLFP